MSVNYQIFVVVAQRFLQSENMNEHPLTSIMA